MMKIYVIILIVLQVISIVMIGAHFIKCKCRSVPKQIGIECGRCHSLIKNAVKIKYQMRTNYPNNYDGRLVPGLHEFVDCPFCGRQNWIGIRIEENAESDDTGEAAESE